MLQRFCCNVAKQQKFDNDGEEKKLIPCCLPDSKPASGFSNCRIFFVIKNEDGGVFAKM